MAITPLPPAPEPTDSTAQFNTKAFAFVASLDGFVTEANATATAVNTSENNAANSAIASAASAVTSQNAAVTAAADATNAAQATVDAAVSSAQSSAAASAFSASASADSADAAATSAETAAAATNAVLWVSGTTYAIGFLVYSPLDNRVYRSLSAFTSTTDPSADATNWVQLTRVVEQSDIGTNPNEVPLNQYLGVMAYVDYPDFTRPFLVASLPAAGITGRFAHVTDGDAGLAWGDTVTNSGSPVGATPYLVFDNGTNWTVTGK